jgi:hypothetical protein
VCRKLLEVLGEAGIRAIISPFPPALSVISFVRCPLNSSHLLIGEIEIDSIPTVSSASSHFLTVRLAFPVSDDYRALEERKMKSRLIILAVCLLVVIPGVVAQTPRATRVSAATQPPPLPQNAFANTSQPDGVIARLFAFQPDIPLGPVEVLKEYEDGMTLIAQRLFAELISISQANRANQITRDEAEYLIQERYQVAMMQHEVLSALHDSLQNDLAQAVKRPSRVSQSDTAVVVQPR